MTTRRDFLSTTAGALVASAAALPALATTASAAPVAAAGLPVASAAMLAPTPVHRAAQAYYAAHAHMMETEAAMRAAERQSPYYAEHERFLEECRAFLDEAPFMSEEERQKWREARDKTHKSLGRRYYDSLPPEYHEAARLDEQATTEFNDAFSALTEAEARCISDIAIKAKIILEDTGPDDWEVPAQYVRPLLEEAARLLPQPEGFPTIARSA